MKPRRPLAVLVLLALPLITLAPGAPAFASTSQRSTVAIPADDGFALQGTLVLPRGKGPGVLLLPECAGDRSAWQSLAAKLGSVGIRALTFDYRGLGASRAGEFTDFPAQRDKILPKMAGDVEAAYRFLVAQTGVDSAGIGIVGAACGATEGLLFAARHPDKVRTLALLSPETDERTTRALGTLPGVPFLLLAGEGDLQAADFARTLFARSAHPESRLVLYKGAAHGMALYAGDRALKGGITDWFENNLPRTPAPPPAPPPAAPGSALPR